MILNDWRVIVILCLTLGLLPYLPEPHLWGKLKWVAGGAHEMTSTDWFDLVLHGLPFFLLIRVIVINFTKKHTK